MSGIGKFLIKNIISKFDVITFSQINHLYLNLKYGRRLKFISFKNPKSFNDKINWLKKYHKIQNVTRYIDKILVKKYVAKKIGKKFIIPTLFEYSSSSQIDLDLLPNSFIIKANHGSGWIIKVLDKTKIKKTEFFDKIDSWLHCNYFDFCKEYQYKDIIPKVLVEKLLVNRNGEEINDYKVFCFHGKPEIIQVDFSRSRNHKRNFYDLKWDRLYFTSLYPESQEQVAKPKQLDQILSISEKLSKDFIFVRVDLYIHNNKIFFGELTLHPGGGYEPILPNNWNIRLGKLINLGNIK